MSFTDLISRMDAAIIDRLKGGETITFTPAGGSVYTDFSAIYEKSFLLAGEEPGTETTAPVLFLQPSELSQTPVNGDIFTVDGVRFKVVGSQPDGQGGMIIILSRAT